MRPELRCCILCDDVRQEKNGKFIFVGVFNVIGAAKFPMLYPVFHIINQWSAGEGKFREQSRIVNEDNHQVVSSPIITFTLKDFNASHFVISRCQNVKFEAAGKYAIEVLLDGELFRRFPFRVVQSARKQVGP
ncbi:MAG: hypothetical protein COV74_01145 [Candidatus Omnitrophica bacterium CG11_big_fil_rev_8_21_14_0_20_45_26]|uniref:Wzt C-terminal domain-containing protein n=1 Tax=Candidatus Abzuiibacterium crystallinum TaxID=1974748 RepID=A0A2H0LUZ8_9BACT|nr:MAG: hypothetical protein COV74_01145 [Candidatus Omnitrophica bacterium CG11_big_fil_rev_8_21_14_0_20_45_26]PIW64765.1 MAG: hypothetical protein COW12_04815 [Candidatus Omnitrophica bacterium CG12_big_fil_rev_8_21_14_0_65_45_16]